MILKSLKLHNIRSYTTQKIDFEEGVTLLAGDIGSGKSTILLAIEFALFGLLRGMLSGTSLLRKGKNEGFVELKFAVNNKDYVIHRQLKRTKTSVTQNHGFMVLDDARQDMTAVELKSKILSILGYPKELITKSKSLVYRYTVYTPQEQMKHILFEEKEARLDTLRRVFDIDKYKRVIDNTQIYVKTLKQRIKSQNERLQDADKIELLKKSKQETLFDVQEQLSSIKPLTEELTQLLQEKQEFLKETQKNVHHVIKIRTELNAIQDDVKNKTHQLKTIAEQISKLNQEITSQKQELEQLPKQENEKNAELVKTELIALETKLQALQTDKQIQEKDLMQIQNEKTKAVYHQNELTKSIQNITQQQDRIKQTIQKQQTENVNPELITQQMQQLLQHKEKTHLEHQQISTEITKLSTQIESSNKILQKLAGLQECPLCLQEVTHDHKQTITNKEQSNQQQWKSQHLEHQEKQKQLSLTIQSLQEQEKTLQEKHTQAKVQQAQQETIKQAALLNQQLEQQLKQKQEELNKWKVIQEQSSQKAESLKQALQSLNQSLEQTTKQHQEIKIKAEQLQKAELQKLKRKQLQELLQIKQQQHDQLTEQTKKLTGELEVKNQAANALETQIKQLGDVEANYTMLTKELEQLQHQHQQIQLQQRELTTRQKDLLETLLQIDKDLGAFKKLRKELAKIKKTQSWLENYFINIAKAIEKQVMQAVYNEFNAMFMKWFGMLMEDEMLSARLDETFSIIIEQNGYESDVSTLSGGEKTAAALAYRLALNKVINEMVGTIKTRDIIVLDEPTDGFSSEQLDKVREVLDQLYLKQVLIVSHESKIETFVDNVIRVHKDNHVSRALAE